MKFKTIIIVFIVIILFAFIGCEESKEYEVTILNVEDYKETTLGEWIKNCKLENGYYQFINSDADSWEMYIYIFNYNKDLYYTTYNVSLEVKDSVVAVDIDSEDALDDSQVMKDILLHITAPIRGTWPSRAEVNVDGKRLEVLEMDITE